jgi:HSP90 family molecular chaperone
MHFFLQSKISTRARVERGTLVGVLARSEGVHCVYSISILSIVDSYCTFLPIPILSIDIS